MPFKSKETHVHVTPVKYLYMNGLTKAITKNTIQVLGVILFQIYFQIFSNVSAYLFKWNSKIELVKRM